MTLQSIILYFAGLNNPTQLLRKLVGFQGNEETKPICAKTAPMILWMEVALQLSFDRTCNLRQPNHWLNNPVRCCSAVAVSTWCINMLGMIVCVRYFPRKIKIHWIWGFPTAVRFCCETRIHFYQWELCLNML